MRPTIPVTGVRTSWLMADNSSAFCWAEDSAVERSSSHSVTSRYTQAISRDPSACVTGRKSRSSRRPSVKVIRSSVTVRQSAISSSTRAKNASMSPNRGASVNAASTQPPPIRASGGAGIWNMVQNA